MKVLSQSSSSSNDGAFINDDDEHEHEKTGKEGGANMAEKLKVGVIGGGAIAQQGHLPFYNAHKAVGSIVVADPSAERQGEITAQFKKVQRVYADYRDLLKQESLDCLSVCAPNFLHARLTVAAAERGVHVLCEKPMALSLAEARRMIAACRHNHVHLMINLTHRFFLGTRKLKALLDQGKIGAPHTLRIRYVHNGPYAGWAKSDWFYKAREAGGGALMDMGVHAVDIGHFLFGPIRAVSASLANLTKQIPVEDSAMILAEFDGGRRAFIEAGWTGGAGFSGIEVCGAKGSITMDFRKGLFLTTGQSLPDGSMAIKEKQIACDLMAGGWGAGIQSFLQHVQAGTAPECDGEAGLAAIQVVLAAYRSAKSGRRVTIK